MKRKGVNERKIARGSSIKSVGGSRNMRGVRGISYTLHLTGTGDFAQKIAHGSPGSSAVSRRDLSRDDSAVNSVANNQVTKYVYGTTLNASTDSDIASNDLLKAVIYPDSDDVDSP